MFINNVNAFPVAKFGLTEDELKEINLDFDTPTDDATSDLLGEIEKDTTATSSEFDASGLLEDMDD